MQDQSLYSLVGTSDSENFQLKPFKHVSANQEDYNSEIQPYKVHMYVWRVQSFDSA